MPQQPQSFGGGVQAGWCATGRLLPWWLTSLLCGGVLLLALSGCADVLSWSQRTVAGVDCRELLPNGHCRPVR